MMLGMRLLIWLLGEHFGSDDGGNRYYRGRGRHRAGRERRWVKYNGAPEATKVPPRWHAWLHHTTDEVPSPTEGDRRPWQREHQPNLTATADAYRPPGHVLKGGRRAATTGDYQPWEPS